MPRSRAVFPNQPMGHLLAKAHAALGMTQQELGEALGVSRRTISRWYARGEVLTMGQIHTLARLVHPRDPALAADLAYAASETLESLGLAAPSASRGGSFSMDVAIDALVCTAAEALGAAPTPVRGALFAAFKRARELGLRMEDVEAALAPVVPAAPTKAGKPA